ALQRELEMADLAGQRTGFRRVRKEDVEDVGRLTSPRGDGPDRDRQSRPVAALESRSPLDLAAPERLEEIGLALRPILSRDPAQDGHTHELRPGSRKPNARGAIAIHDAPLPIHRQDRHRRRFVELAVQVVPGHCVVLQGPTRIASMGRPAGTRTAYPSGAMRRREWPSAKSASMAISSSRRSSVPNRLGAIHPLNVPPYMTSITTNAQSAARPGSTPCAPATGGRPGAGAEGQGLGVRHQSSAYRPSNRCSGTYGQPHGQSYGTSIRSHTRSPGHACLPGHSGPRRYDRPRRGPIP